MITNDNQRLIRSGIPIKVDKTGGRSQTPVWSTVNVRISLVPTMYRIVRDPSEPLWKAQLLLKPLWALKHN